MRTPDLGDGGVKALRAERAARKHAERTARELRAALRAAVEDADQLAGRIETALERISE